MINKSGVGDRFTSSSNMNKYVLLSRAANTKLFVIMKRQICKYLSRVKQANMQMNVCPGFPQRHNISFASMENQRTNELSSDIGGWVG